VGLKKKKKKKKKRKVSPGHLALHWWGLPDPQVTLLALLTCARGLPDLQICAVHCSSHLRTTFVAKSGVTGSVFNRFSICLMLMKAGLAVLVKSSSDLDCTVSACATRELRRWRGEGCQESVSNFAPKPNRTLFAALVGNFSGIFLHSRLPHLSGIRNQHATPFCQIVT
jgi:hypothetical protein